MPTILVVRTPRDEVLKGVLREDTFAARLGDVISGSADPVCDDPSTFFDNATPLPGSGDYSATRWTGGAVMRPERMPLSASRPPPGEAEPTTGSPCPTSPGVQPIRAPSGVCRRHHPPATARRRGRRRHGPSDPQRRPRRAAGGHRADRGGHARDRAASRARGRPRSYLRCMRGAGGASV